MSIYIKNIDINNKRWKSMENDFRKESPFKISCIPTLLNLKTVQ